MYGPSKFDFPGSCPAASSSAPLDVCRLHTMTCMQHWSGRTGQASTARRGRNLVCSYSVVGRRQALQASIALLLISNPSHAQAAEDCPTCQVWLHLWCWKTRCSCATVHPILYPKPASSEIISTGDAALQGNVDGSLGSCAGLEICSSSCECCVPSQSSIFISSIKMMVPAPRGSNAFSGQSSQTRGSGGRDQLF